jgi:hypothetical protein
MDKHSSPHRWLLAAALAVSATVSPFTQAGTPAAAKNPAPAPVAAANWKDNTISSVSNPIFFEDPVIRNEVRPIFAYHRIDDAIHHWRW